MAYIILSLRFTMVVRLIVSSRWKDFVDPQTPRTAQDSIRVVASPYPTGTFALLVMKSFACCTNARLSGKYSWLKY
nr:hypothetical protein [uncultured Amphritea sp.]